jgi:hypothetical protein
VYLLLFKEMVIYIVDAVGENDCFEHVWQCDEDLDSGGGALLLQTW